MEDAIVQMSPTYVDKLIKELVHNAFKFSEARTPVRIGGRRNGQAYTVSVQDQGRGMTAEQIADVGAYLQFERARHEQQGQGLGLTIARRLAELHRGQLSIESVPGQQTVVRVVFPMPS
jgi:signal transduction histidine kinase